ncbi:hypothetical protein [Dongia sp.]|uniref:hypothetical protein n=1 Tax=Dongia sp. TaxID=1977262 RepID=UPI0035B047F4
MLTRMIYLSGIALVFSSWVGPATANDESSACVSLIAKLKSSASGFNSKSKDGDGFGFIYDALKLKEPIDPLSVMDADNPFGQFRLNENDLAALSEIDYKAPFSDVTIYKSSKNLVIANKVVGSMQCNWPVVFAVNNEELSLRSDYSSFLSGKASGCGDDATCSCGQGFEIYDDGAGVVPLFVRMEIDYALLQHSYLLVPMPLSGLPSTENASCQVRVNFKDELSFIWRRGHRTSAHHLGIEAVIRELEQALKDGIEFEQVQKVLRRHAPSADHKELLGILKYLRGGSEGAGSIADQIPDPAIVRLSLGDACEGCNGSRDQQLPRFIAKPTYFGVVVDNEELVVVYGAGTNAPSSSRSDAPPAFGIFEWRGGALTLIAGAAAALTGTFVDATMTH